MFSEREIKIIRIIGKKKLTIEDVSSELFKGDKNTPFDANITVSNSIRRIINKCAFYSSHWTLTKERSNGKMYIKKVTFNDVNI